MSKMVLQYHWHRQDVLEMMTMNLLRDDVINKRKGHEEIDYNHRHVSGYRWCFA